MKEATGEVSMTVVTLVAIAAVGALMVFIWPTVRTKVNNMWGNDAKKCTGGKIWDSATSSCK